MKKIVICIALKSAFLCGMELQEESIEGMQERYLTVIEKWKNEKDFKKKLQFRDEMLELDDKIVKRLLSQEITYDSNFNDSINLKKNAPLPNEKKLISDDNILLKHLDTSRSINLSSIKNYCAKSGEIEKLLELIVLAYNKKMKQAFSFLTKSIFSFEITNDFMQKVSVSQYNVSSEIINDMSKMLLPGNVLKVQLHGKIKNLQQLLFVIAFRKREFPKNMINTGIWQDLDSNITFYLQWQEKNHDQKNSPILFFLTDGCYELLKNDALKSNNFENLIPENGPYDPILLPLQFDTNTFRLLWELIKNPSLALLRQVNEKNYQALLYLDNYLDIKSKKDYAEKWVIEKKAVDFEEKIEETPFYSLMKKKLINDIKYIDTFCCRAFMRLYYTMDHFIFYHLSDALLGDKAERISLSCSENNNTTKCDFIVYQSEGTAIACSYQKEEDKFAEELKRRLTKFIAKHEPWKKLLEQPDFNEGSACIYKKNSIEIKKGDRILVYSLQETRDAPTSYTMFSRIFKDKPDFTIGAVGTSKGYMEIFVCDFDKKKTYFLHRFSIHEFDLMRYKGVIPPVEIMNWSSDGKYLVGVWRQQEISNKRYNIKVVQSSEFIKDMMQKFEASEKESNEKESKVFTKPNFVEEPANGQNSRLLWESFWSGVKDSIIPTVLAAGGWWLYGKYFKKQPSAKIENE